MAVSHESLLRDREKLDFVYWLFSNKYEKKINTLLLNLEFNTGT